MFDFDNPFYRPLWRRAVLVAACMGWGGAELATNSPGFAILFLALGGYAAYRLFVTFDPDRSNLSDLPET